MAIFNYDKSNMDELKQYISIHKNMSLVSFRPHLEKASNFFLQKLGITAALYQYAENLETAAIAGTPPTGLDLQLLQKMQSVVAWYALYTLLPDNMFSVADGGNSLEGYTAPSDKVFNKKLYATLRNAHDELETLVWNFLLPNQSTFTDFDSTEAVELFIASPKVLIQHQSSIEENGVLELWFKTRTDARKIEHTMIQPILGTPTFNALKLAMQTEMLGGTAMTATDTQLLYLVRELAIENTLNIAAPKLNGAITPNGAKSSTRENSNATSAEMNDLTDQLQKNSSRSVKMIFDFLEENKANYTDWAESKNNPNFVDENEEIKAPKKSEDLLHNTQGGAALF